MIAIEPIGRNPFTDHPLLLNIWPELSSANMYSVTIESIENNEGGLFFIKNGTNVIGITGYFILDDLITFGLRWTGVIQPMRNKGYTSIAIIKVLHNLKEHYPSAEYIVEYIPQVSYNIPIIKFFEKMGFEKIGELESWEWTPHLNQGYRANINNLLKRYENYLLY